MSKKNNRRSQPWPLSIMPLTKFPAVTPILSTMEIMKAFQIKTETMKKREINKRREVFRDQISMKIKMNKSGILTKRENRKRFKHVTQRTLKREIIISWDCIIKSMNKKMDNRVKKKTISRI
jgi:hypothetical protein